MFGLSSKKAPVNQEPSYKESKEYLDRQQDIDYLLVLANFISTGIYSVDKDLFTDSVSSAKVIIQKLK